MAVCMKKTIGSLFSSFVSFILLSCASCASSASSDPAADYSNFKNPELVTISGYSDNAMEPFISRDGSCLFFNNNSGSSTDKDIFYASRIDDTHFAFQRALSEVDSAEVDGVPTLDKDNHFYFISMAGYAPPADYCTVHAGTWSGSAVSGIANPNGLFIGTSLVLYFDVEAGCGGSTLYLSRGDFNGGSPKTADIVIAVKSGSGFSYDSGKDYIMANVNTSDLLEYAPALSKDELELFFTRLDAGSGTSRIYRAVRSDTGSAFGIPELVAAIDGFAEGPALSPDEKSLYYHRLNPSTAKYEIYRVSRE